MTSRDKVVLDAIPTKKTGSRRAFGINHFEEGNGESNPGSHPFSGGHCSRLQDNGKSPQRAGGC